MNEIITKDLPRIQKLLFDVLGTDRYTNISRLGGLTNHTYKVTMTDGSIYSVRLPGDGTEVLINRTNEKNSTRLACSLGIDAKMLYFGASGEKVSCYINGATTLCADSFQNQEILCKAADVLRILHTCGADTGVPFDVFDMARGYEKIIRDNNVSLFDGYERVKNKITEIHHYTENLTPSNRTPCHNDPLCENWVLSDSGKLYLIDWEYAGMNDPMWDLADIAIEADLTQVQENILLERYFSRTPDTSEYIRFHANKLFLDYLWALWGKTRVPFSGMELEQYAQERYLRLQNNLNHFLLHYPMV